MAGKRAQELATDRRLVNTHAHLLPRLRGSEKRRLAELAAARGEELTQEDVERQEQELAATAKATSGCMLLLSCRRTPGTVRRLGCALHKPRVVELKKTRGTIGVPILLTRGTRRAVTGSITGFGESRRILPSVESISSLCALP